MSFKQYSLNVNFKIVLCLTSKRNLQFVLQKYIRGTRLCQFKFQGFKLFILVYLFTNVIKYINYCITICNLRFWNIIYLSGFASAYLINLSSENRNKLNNLN